ncbi:hypothetical protein [Embleya hyalina]|uniref:Uncharacterized protein n=1 Tax=Embleya hyalina TaxID=516124 RepID=A0A401YGL7_9ACTN|nr:hypothetical protein [Embleya hyalina]GCD93752.1 hypothetical protein EHYA_01400 [Embleya hyalina]
MGPVEDARRREHEIEQTRVAEERERLGLWGIDARRGVRTTAELAAFLTDLAGQLPERKLVSLFLHVDTREQKAGLFGRRTESVRVFEAVGKGWELATLAAESGCGEHTLVLSPDGRLFEARRVDAASHRGLPKGGGLTLVPTSEDVIALTPDLRSLLLDHLDARTGTRTHDPSRPPG